MVSFDGLGGVRLGQLLDAGLLRAGGFAAFVERGVVAGRAVTVTPSQTSVAHVAAITGAPPSRTGIVGNVFQRAGDPFGTSVSGFGAEIEVETLWEAAIRQGKRVGVLVYPGADGTTARRRGSFGLLWPDRPLLGAKVLRLTRENWEPTAPLADSFSQPRAAAMTIETPGGPRSLRMLALDSTNDGVVNFDVVRIAGGDSGRQLASVREGGWFRLDAPGGAESGETGAWCRLAAIDPHLESVVLYVGAFYGVQAYPEDYRRRLMAAVGPWPGQADPVFVRGDPSLRSAEAFEEQSTRLSDYLTRALLTTIRTERWDLLVHYQPAVDEMEHAFEPGGPGQQTRAAGSSAIGPDWISRAYQDADLTLARILEALGSGDSLFALSDHGMSHVEQAVDLERFLAMRGWRCVRGATPDEGGTGRDVHVCASSGIAHLYLRHDAAGRLSPDLLAVLRADLGRLSLEYDVPFEAILGRADLHDAGLDHPNSGDLVVLLRPGYVFERGPDDTTVLFSSHSSGAHGYRNTHPELDASFLALGPRVRRGHPAIVSLLDAASEVARALGIEPPGRSIERTREPDVNGSLGHGLR